MDRGAWEGRSGAALRTLTAAQIDLGGWRRDNSAAPVVTLDGGVAPSSAVQWIRSLAGSQIAVNKSRKLRFRERTDLLRGDFTAFEQDQRRDAPDTIFRWGARIGIDVELGHHEPACVILGDVVEDRGNRLAGAAPLRPIVDQHGRTCLEDVGIETCVADMLDMVAHGFLAVVRTHWIRNHASQG